MVFLLDRAIFPWDLAILLLTSGSLCVLIAAAVRLRRKHLRIWSRIAVSLAGILAFAVLLTVLYGSFLEPSLIVTTTDSVRLNVGEPLTIAVISDMHLGPYKGAGFLQRIVDTVNAERPDLVFLMGDYFADESASYDNLLPLNGLQPSLGTFAVFGNYETGHTQDIFGFKQDMSDRLQTLLRMFPSMGITPLRNEHQIIPLHSGSFAIAGVGDVMSGDDDLRAALEGIERGTPTILLSHNPDVALNPLSASASLIISGHTHGGQFRLPFIGPIAPIPTKLGRAYDQGVFTLSGGTVLAITRGVGETMSRARLFAPPEILILKTTP